jgi:hypothetical protein
MRTSFASSSHPRAAGIGRISIRETPIYWRFLCGAGRPAIFKHASA